MLAILNAVQIWRAKKQNDTGNEFDDRPFLFSGLQWKSGFYINKKKSSQFMKKYKNVCISTISRYVPKAHNCLIDDLNYCPNAFCSFFTKNFIFLFFAVF